MDRSSGIRHFIGSLPGRAGTLLSEVLLAAGICVSAAISFVSNLFMPYAEPNYKYNSGYKFTGYIFDQNSGSAALLRMGYFKGSYNGCGWVATYNAALLMGAAPQPADIIRYYDTHGAALVNGAFGINPLAVKMYCRKSGIRSRIFSLPARVDERISASEVSVLAYMHSKGAHYVAVHRAEGMFLIYNGPEKTAPAGIRSVDSWIAAEKYRPISLITLRSCDKSRSKLLNSGNGITASNSAKIY